MGKIIGIDLGTTNSCVAVVEGGRPVVIPNREGQRTTPSVVAFTKTGERLVGDPAKRQAVTNAARTVCSVKRKMGSDARIPIDGKCYTPQEISALILQKLRADAEAYLGEPVTEAVIPRTGLFQRCPAPGHQGCRAHCRAECSAHHKRTHRRSPGLRAGQRQGPDRHGVRPGRRYF